MEYSKHNSKVDVYVEEVDKLNFTTTSVIVGQEKQR